MEFRRDINGLRAYAVLAVMLFHFGIGQATGGFAGVDIFFVLSGYLMTSIIAGGLLKGKFSFLAFYLARARRILPALAALCVALLALGCFWLAPADYELLGKHAGSAVLFTSNFTFQGEEGYFDVPSKTKWLLHTWSLSVEWQFYLLYPLLLACVARFWPKNRRALTITLWITATLSLAFSVIMSPLEPTMSFYLLPARMWELVAGGLVWCYATGRTPRHGILLEWLGLAAIAASLFLFTALTPWPGYNALLPVLGTVLVLLSGRQDSFVTANPVMQALGRWSYSVYLWHWPVVVALGYFGLEKATEWVAGGMTLSVALGALSYQFVEQPARRYFTGKSQRIGYGAALAAMAVITLVGLGIERGHGLPFRVPAEVAQVDAESENTFKDIPKGCGFDRKTKKLTPCDVDAEKGIRWIVLGDSHARPVAGALHLARPGGIRYYSHQCATMFNAELKTKGRNNGCTEFMEQVRQQVDALPRSVPLIVINRYSVNLEKPNEGTTRPIGFTYTDLDASQEAMNPGELYKKRMVETLCSFAKTRRVIAVKPVPEIGRDVPKTLAREWMVGHPVRDITISRADYARRNRVPLATLEEAHRSCGVALIDPVPTLCDANACYGARDGKPLYVDDDHLSMSGSALLAPLFKGLR